MKKTELVFIPSPGYAHLSSTIEIAKLLAERDEHLSISVIIMIFPNDSKVSSFVKSLSTYNSSSCLSRIKFIELIQETMTQTGLLSLYKFIESHKSQVRDFLGGLKSDSECVKLCGVVVDMFCTSMIDVTNELDIPSYGFFTCSGAMLGLLFHFQELRDDFGKYVEDNGSGFSIIPSYKNHVPYGVLPPMVFRNQEGCDEFLDIGKRFRETKGILVNTFLELESYAIDALSRDEGIPKVYTLGPILGLKDCEGGPETEKIVKWLDLQAEKSVVYLCFGSYGHFGEAQVKEIARGLEGSGYKFLWSLRKPPVEGRFEFPGEYEGLELEEVLPEGFLRRVAEGDGMVIGWAPQTAVLSHSAVGGFVSHCGWSSVLESIWFGVPLATWPLYAEQQVNAFELVTDLGLSVEVKMDYKTNLMKHDDDEIIESNVIEEKIKILMDPENGIRKKVKDMKEMSRLALEDGGSSFASLKCFINDTMSCQGRW